VAEFNSDNANWSYWLAESTPDNASLS